MLDDIWRRGTAFLLAFILFVSVLPANMTDFLTGNTEVYAEEPGEPIEPAGNLSGFAYESLSDEEKLIYAQLYAGIRDLKSEFTISASDSDRIGPALSAILTDCPEFFWIDGSASMSGFKILGIWTITLGFNIPAEEIESRREQIEQKAEEYLAMLPEGASDYDKVKAAYEFIIRNTDYSTLSEQNQNIQSVFIYGKSVCAGYARAFKYLLDLAGVECAYVEGETGDADAEGHAWNIVNIDGVFTQVDPSWGDPTYGEDNTDAKRLEIIYDYLCLTTEEMERTGHIPAHPDMLPACDNRSFDYYILNGYWHDEYVSEDISRVLWHAVDEEESVVYMKFADDEAYAEALYALFPGEDGPESLIAAPMRQRMEWDEISSLRYYYSCSDELRIIKIYW